MDYQCNWNICYCRGITGINQFGMGCVAWLLDISTNIAVLQRGFDNSRIGIFIQFFITHMFYVTYEKTPLIKTMHTENWVSLYLVY